MGLLDFGRKKGKDAVVSSGTSGSSKGASEDITKSGSTQTSARSVLEDEDKKNQPDTDDELEDSKVYFKLDLRPKVINIPEYSDHTKVNIKYDLIPPHSSVHIFWDHKNGELVYYVEEPELNDMESEILRLVTLGLEEMINISFINAAKNKKVVQYLEHNVQSILAELGTKVSMDTYQKIMYYIYRDFIGVNEIEPLLRDYYIEDIECNGADSPVYVVHRKFRNIRSNIKFNGIEHLSIFVEKLSQKCGRYVSYAQPLLDGTLPDGSRVNATYSDDVTTRGPTFTIRKFTKDPWMPTNLMRMGTCSAEAFAYLWLCVEHKMNIITIGETGAGKTTILNSIATFIPEEARIVSIEDTRELNLAHENWLPSVTREGFGVTNVTGEKYGEINLFTLLKESFRQNPDYVIVGEVRDQATSVLFQGMASGHSCFSTFHAGSVDALVRRLTTPPISLPGSLVESMNIVVQMHHLKDHENNIRRVKEVNEIISVSEAGDVDSKTPFAYNPADDSIKMKSEIYSLDVIGKMLGITSNDVMEELQTRAKLLQKMADNNITDYKEFSKVITEYYTNPRTVLQRYGISSKTLQEMRDEKSSRSETRKTESAKIRR